MLYINYNSIKKFSLLFLFSTSVTCIAFQSTWQLYPAPADTAFFTASSDNGEVLQLSGQNQLRILQLHFHFSFGHAELLEIWKIFWVGNLAAVISLCKGQLSFYYLWSLCPTIFVSVWPVHMLTTPFYFQFSVFHFDLFHGCRIALFLGDIGNSIPTRY